jgi:hypothetical protein
MCRIWKYVLAITDEQQIVMPRGAKLLSVGIQDEILCLWAYVRNENNFVAREIRIVGTGHPCDAGSANFVGTAIDDRNGLAWHVFDGITETELKGDTQ